MGKDFVTLHIDGSRIFAYTMGKAFCVDAATGQKLWENALRGYGYGFATLATTTGSTPPPIPPLIQAQSAATTPPPST